MPKLDRLRRYDLRSLNFPAASALPSGAQRVTKYWRMTGSALDQGDFGACVGHGFAHELMIEPQTLCQSSEDAFRIYYEAQRMDPWPGGAYAGADPFYEGTSVLAGAQILKRTGLYKSYRWATSIDEAVLSLGHLGPAVVGWDWYGGMYTPDAEGFIRPTGHIEGGHCVCLIGVNVDTGDPVKDHVVVFNSWGVYWGKSGTAKVSLADLALLWPGSDFCVPERGAG